MIGSRCWMLGFIRFWREPQPLFFVNVPSIILRPDKYNNMTRLFWGLPIFHNDIKQTEIHLRVILYYIIVQSDLFSDN